MLKRIEVSQVRAGMFIEAVEGVWQDSFLRRRRFFLRGETEARKLKSSGVEFLVINATKGVDVSGGAATETDGKSAEAALRERAIADSNAARQTIQQSTQSLTRVFDEVKAGSAVSLDEVAPVISDISESIDRNPAVFISITRLKSKDEATFQHSISVSALMIHFGRYLRLDETTVKLLGIAGLLHDVGKLEIPPEILMKKGRLDDSEVKAIRDHPTIGYAILSRQEGMPEIVLDVCRNHHERMDGKGYPGMLAGKNISLHARIAAICDVYDAVTSVRPYKRPWTAAEALRWMFQSEGHFDLKLLRKFVLCLAVSAEIAA